jgi:hypothetical protein
MVEKCRLAGMNTIYRKYNYYIYISYMVVQYIKAKKNRKSMTGMQKKKRISTIGLFAVLITSTVDPNYLVLLLLLLQLPSEILVV